MKQRVTRDDVAQRAGVSSAVVSYVVNNSPRPVSAKTRTRVLQAIEELGYRTNYVARSLRLQRTHTLGIIISDSANAYFGEVVKGIEDQALNLDFNILVGNTNNNLDRKSTYIDSFISRKVDGIIFVGTTLCRRDIELLNQFRIPALYIGSEGELEPQMHDSINAILFATEKGGYEVGRYMLGRGHHRMACIVGKHLTHPFVEVKWFRLEGFRQALGEAGLQPQVLWQGETFQDGFLATLTLLDSDQPPTAIFACNDMVAIGALRAAADRGLIVPKDLAVCGFDDLEVASYVHPRLTTMRIPKLEIGEQAAKMLVEHIQAQSGPQAKDNPIPANVTLRYETKLIIREST